MKILDTSAWIEYFGATRRGEAVRECVDGGEEIVIPDVVLAELARKLKREGVKDEEVKRVLYFVSSRSRVEAIDVELALLSAVRWVELDRRARECGMSTPSLTDAILLAIAHRYSEAEILSTDRHFEGLPRVQMLK
jgi:predicted nucleic acid-binding protein